MTRQNPSLLSGGRGEEGTTMTSEEQQSQNNPLTSLLLATTTNAISNVNNNNNINAPRGIDALYHPATAGIDTLLQFQWMRIHPSEVLSIPLSPMTTTTTTATSTTTTATLKRKRDDEHHHPTTSDRINQNTIPCRSSPYTDLSVALTELLSPPLQVEWIPGLETSDESDEDETDDITTDAKRQASEDETDDLATCVMEAVRLADDEDCDDDGGRHVGLLEQLSRVSSTEGLTHALSSRSFLSALGTLSSSSHSLSSPERQRRRRHRQRTKKQFLEVGLRALLLLTEHAGTEVMGGYILRVLAPIMFRFLAMSTKETEDDDEGTKDLTETERELIQQLAFSLIRNCRLGNLSRMELSEMMFGGSSSTSSSVEGGKGGGSGGDEGMDELRFCVGEAFFSWRESVCR